MQIIENIFFGIGFYDYFNVNLFNVNITFNLTNLIGNNNNK